MAEKNVWIDFVDWFQAGIGRLEEFRKKRDGGVSAEEADLITEFFGDFLWAARIIPCMVLSAFDHRFPRWFYASYPDARTETELFRYLVARLSEESTDSETYAAAIGLLTPSQSDTTKLQTVMEAMLTYAFETRSAEYTDTLVSEVESLEDIIGVVADRHFGDDDFPSVARVVVHPDDDDTMLFGFEFNDGHYVRIGVGDPEPKTLQDVYKLQLDFAKSMGPALWDSRIGTWTAIADQISPGIAYKRIVLPLLTLSFQGKTDSRAAEDCLGVGDAYRDLIDNIGTAYDDLDKALRVGLSEEEAAEIDHEWYEAVKRSLRKVDELKRAAIAQPTER